MKKNILILGASAPIAKAADHYLINNSNANVTLFMRNPAKVYAANRTIIGDATDVEALTKAMHKIDVVIAVLGPKPMPVFAEAVIKAMHQAKVKRLIWIASLGIYDLVDKNLDEYMELGSPDDLNSYLGDQRLGADLLMESDLDVTIVRPNALTSDDIVTDVKVDLPPTITKLSTISRKTVGVFIAKLALQPNKYLNESPALTAAK